MRLLGLDVGTKTIGLALSDPMGWTAQPLLTLQRTTLQRDIAALQALFVEHGVEGLVVGLPRSMDGSLGSQAEWVLGFIERLQQAISLPIETWDERLSTVAVERILKGERMSREKQKKVVDKLAAAWILQGYLDAQAAAARRQEQAP